MSFVNAVATPFTASFGNFTLNWPSGLVAGQRAMCFIASLGGAGLVLDNTADFSAAIGTNDTTSPGISFRALEKKVVVGNETASAFHMGSSDTGIGVIAVLNNRHATNPVSFITPTTSGDASTTTSPRTLTLASGNAASGDDLLVFNIMGQGSSADVWNASNWSNGITEFLDSNTAWLSYALGYLNSIATPGAFGNVSVDITHTTGSGGAAAAAFVVAIPSAGGGAPTLSQLERGDRRGAFRGQYVRSDSGLLIPDHAMPSRRRRIWTTF